MFRAFLVGAAVVLVGNRLIRPINPKVCPDDMRPLGADVDHDHLTCPVCRADFAMWETELTEKF